MSLSAEVIESIKTVLEDFSEIDTNPLSALRSSFPQVSFLQMSAADVGETPYISLRQYELHLLDGRDHCVKLTQILNEATGVILAKKTS